MRMKLIEYKPKRLFAFGCSFTNYFWPTWAQIVAYDLNIPLYNYGRSGSGNQYIFNHIMQADNYYKFDENDLIMVCWTNVMREDRWFNGDWQTPGNIFTQTTYPKEFVDAYANETFSCLRDFAYVKVIYEFLKAKNCQFHYLKMMDFEEICQWSKVKGSPNPKIYLQYREYLNYSQPSFYKILWHDNLNIKYAGNKLIHHNWKDIHPTVNEHFKYIRKVFDEHQFSEATENIVNIKHEEFIASARQQAENWSYDVWKPWKFDVVIKKPEPIQLV